jgi:hypothetical protein
MITVIITVVIVIRPTRISPVVVIVLADYEIGAASLVYPDSIAVSAPGAALNAGLLAVLPHHSEIVRVAVPRNLAFLTLPVRSTVEPLCAGLDASEQHQCNKYQEQQRLLESTKRHLHPTHTPSNTA